MKCKHTKEDGKSCGANAMRGNKYCFLHNPDISQEKKTALCREGGQNRALTVKKPLKIMKIETSGDVRCLLADTINQVRRGKLDVRIANCIGVLSGHMIRAIETDTIEQRVEQIERIVLERRTTFER